MNLMKVGSYTKSIGLTRSTFKERATGMTFIQETAINPPNSGSNRMLSFSNSCLYIS